MDSLYVVRVIVSPRSAHASAMDVVGHHVAVVGQLFIAEGAYALLGDNLPIEKFSHFAVRADFPVSPGMVWSSIRLMPIWHWRFSLEICSLPQQKWERWIGQS